jgi:hypothetical protein
VFETLFKYPRVVARHRTGPSVEARERFLTHCVRQGLAGATLLRHARELLVIAERIDITSGEPIGSPAIEMAADQPTHDPPHDCDPPAPRWRGHPHCPRLARARLAGHHQHLCGNRSGNESQSSRQV